MASSVIVVTRFNNFGKAMAALKRGDAMIPTDLAKYCADRARVYVPVRTGALKESIVAIRSDVHVGAHYGGYVEFGTVYMAARPYLRPAFNDAMKLAPAMAAGLFSHMSASHYGHSDGGGEVAGPGEPPVYGFRNMVLT